MSETSSGIPELLTAQEVADVLRVSLNTVYSWARSGELDSIRVGRSVRFRRVDLDRLTERAS